MNSIEELGNTGEQENLFPLGGGFFAKGMVADADQVLVNVGAQTYVMRPLSEARDHAEQRKQDLEKMLEEIESQLQDYSERINQIVNKVNALQRGQ